MVYKYTVCYVMFYNKVYNILGGKIVLFQLVYLHVIFNNVMYSITLIFSMNLFWLRNMCAILKQKPQLQPHSYSSLSVLVTKWCQCNKEIKHFYSLTVQSHNLSSIFALACFFFVIKYIVYFQISPVRVCTYVTCMCICLFNHIYMCLRGLTNHHRSGTFMYCMYYSVVMNVFNLSSFFNNSD